MDFSFTSTGPVILFNIVVLDPGECICGNSSLKMSDTVEEMPGAPWGHCTHAIVVCGHAIFLGGRSCAESDAGQDKSWILQSFQSGEGVYYLRHVRSAWHLCQFILTSMDVGSWSVASS